MTEWSMDDMSLRFIFSSPGVKATVHTVRHFLSYLFVCIKTHLADDQQASRWVWESKCGTVSWSGVPYLQATSSHLKNTFVKHISLHITGSWPIRVRFIHPWAECQWCAKIVFVTIEWQFFPKKKHMLIISSGDCKHLQKSVSEKSSVCPSEHL